MLGPAQAVVPTLVIPDKGKLTNLQWSQQAITFAVDTASTSSVPEGSCNAPMRLD